MASISSVRDFSSSLTTTLQERTQLAARDITDGAERLSKRKEAVSDSGLRTLQKANETSQLRADTMRKIDTFA